MPHLSVIIPNYNHAQYLPEQLDAILSQTYPPVEIIVVDDASTDNSCEVVTQYQKKGSHILLLQLEKNSGGPTVPIWEGLKKAKGDYLALCASDDMIGPHFFEEAMRLIEEHPEVGMCSGDFSTFLDQKPYQFKPVSLFQTEKTHVFLPETTVEICRKHRFYIPSQTTIYKKELILKYGGYQSKLETLADFYLNCQIAFQHPIGYIPKTLGAYRIRGDSYARAFRYEIKKRNRVFAFMMSEMKKESALFQKRIKRSGILAQAGLYMMAYLAFHPRHWDYLPAAFYKRIHA